MASEKLNIKDYSCIVCEHPDKRICIKCAFCDQCSLCEDCYESTIDVLKAEELWEVCSVCNKAVCESCVEANKMLHLDDSLDMKVKDQDGHVYAYCAYCKDEVEKAVKESKMLRTDHKTVL
jgi:hypothetical protein